MWSKIDIPSLMEQRNIFSYSHTQTDDRCDVALGHKSRLGIDVLHADKGSVGVSSCGCLRLLQLSISPNGCLGRFQGPILGPL